MILILASALTLSLAIENELPTGSGDASAVIQAEKLRMSLLELRELAQGEHRTTGGLLLISGAALSAQVALFLAGSRTDRTEVVSQEIAVGAFGLILIGTGISRLLKRPYEEAVWEELQALNPKKSSDAEVYLAQGEAIFAGAVEHSASERRLTGYVFVGVGVVDLILSLVVSRQWQTNPRDYFSGQLVNFALVGAGLFYLFAVQSPAERAWGAYLNDKNLLHASSSRIRPLVRLSSNSATAGMEISF
jgi:hypothetical protein